MEFGVWDLGFGVWNLGFGIWDLEFGVWNLGFIWDLFGIWDLGFGIWDLGFGAGMVLNVPFTANGILAEIRELGLEPELARK